MDYSEYQTLKFEHRPNGVLLVTISRPEALNAANARMHMEMAQVWKTVAADDSVRVVLVTGEGEAFSAGGDFDMLEQIPQDPETIYATMQEAADIVYGITNLDVPVISAINGVAVGAGLAMALMADISIMAEEARFSDGHLRLGVAAGDHAVIIWPLLCGMAKAKYYLLTADFIDGAEAERIGLVSRAVPGEKLMETALDVADRLAGGSRRALAYTKRSLNNWLRLAGPTFDNSLALEFLTFLSDDMKEGLRAVREKRRPDFR